jgi:hypothetical protein
MRYVNDGDVGDVLQEIWRFGSERGVIVAGDSRLGLPAYGGGWIRQFRSDVNPKADHQIA